MAPSSTSKPDSPSHTSQNGGEVQNPRSSLWTIETISGKGKGLIAAQDITPGTLILSEEPLITTECVTSPDLDITESDFSKALKKLSKASQQTFLSLHNNFPGKYPLYGIFRSNAYPFGPNSEVGGVFATISRINHNCNPNCVQSWNPLLERETVYSVRPIPAGSEITTAYHVGGPSTERKPLLKEHFGFDCACEVCSLPDEKLRTSDARMIRVENLDKCIGDAETVRYSPAKVLKNCKTVLSIFEAENIKDDRLSRLYYDCFQVCNMHSDQARARVFAKKYCEAKKMAAGKDSIDLLEMMPYVKKPATHSSYGSTNDWKTEIGDMPKGVTADEFRRWMWREDL